MDAAADYLAARDALTHQTLPAYVSYAIETHAGFDAIKGDDRTTIVVRTSDGKIMSGTPPKLTIDSDHRFADDILRNGPFKPECYIGTAATLTVFDARPAEAIALRSTCRSAHPDEHSDRSDFRTLYVDPQTRRPIAVIGDADEQYVKARLAERFTVADGLILPENFSVTIAGSGPMFWLNVDAHQAYSEYRFMSRLP